MGLPFLLGQRTHWCGLAQLGVLPFSRIEKERWPVVFIRKLSGFCRGYFFLFREEQHEINNAAEEKQNGPELGRRQPRNEVAPMIASEKLNPETPETISHHVYRKVIAEVFFESEEEQDQRKKDQEDRFPKVGGPNLVVHPRECHPKERGSFLPIATACAKAADPSETVGDADTGGSDNGKTRQESAITFSKYPEIAEEKRGGSADQSAEESESPSPVISPGVFDEIVEVLEQNGRENPNDNRNNGIDFDVDDEPFVLFFSAEINLEIDKSHQNA